MPSGRVEFGSGALEVASEEILGLAPHRFAENVTCIGFNVVSELFVCVLGLVSTANDFHAAANFVDWTATVQLAEIQMKWARSNESRDIGCVTVPVNSRNEIRKAMQHVFAVDAGVGRQAAVADQCFQTRLPGSDQPRMSRSHRVAVAANSFRADLGSDRQEVHGTAHVEDILPG